MGKIKLVCYTEDPFFQQEIQRRGLPVQLLAAEQPLSLSQGEDSVEEITLIVDLMAQQQDPFALIERWRQQHSSTVVVGLVHPAAYERKAAAKLAGIRYLLPRDRFADLLEWIAQYLQLE